MRLEPERFFAIMDWHLAHGAGAVAERDALRDYEGHRSEDWLMIAMRHYVTRDMAGARQAVGHVKPASLAYSSRIERGRMLGLWLMLQILARLPWLAWPAAAFYCRWLVPRTGGQRNSLAALPAVLRAVHVGGLPRAPGVLSSRSGP